VDFGEQVERLERRAVTDGDFEVLERLLQLPSFCRMEQTLHELRLGVWLEFEGILRRQTAIRCPGSVNSPQIT
jgi:hypothetical protein